MIALSRCRKCDPNRVRFANHFRDSLTRGLTAIVTLSQNLALMRRAYVRSRPNPDVQAGDPGAQIRSFRTDLGSQNAPFAMHKSSRLRAEQLVDVQLRGTPMRVILFKS